MTEFFTPVDIANRCLQFCGATILGPLGFTEDSKNAQQVAFTYGKVRRAELRRNVWRFATRRALVRAIDTNTMLLTPTLFNQNVTYFRGSIVSDQANNLWISRVASNVGNDPMNSLTWEPYFGPVTVALYDSGTTYGAGELVYTVTGDGTYNVYISLVNGNSVHPALPNQWSTNTTYFRDQVVQVFAAWSSVTTYSKGQSVNFQGNIYASLINSNLNNSPASNPTKSAKAPTLPLSTVTTAFAATVPLPPTTSPVLEWSQSKTYALGDFVMFNSLEWVSLVANNTGNFPNSAGSTSWAQMTGGDFYMSLLDLNIGNDPLAAPLLTSIVQQGGGNPMWLQIGGLGFPNGVGIAPLTITYPLAVGPVERSSGNRNMFRLPAGYLRMAPQDSKAGSVSHIGASTNLPYKDWLFEGDFFVSRETGPIMLRFVADITDVRAMDDMFCEGFAARLAREIVETLTQSHSSLADVAKIYKDVMGEARLVNAIEIGSEEQPEDDFLSARR